MADPTRSHLWALAIDYDPECHEPLPDAVVAADALVEVLREGAGYSVSPVDSALATAPPGEIVATFETWTDRLREDARGGSVIVLVTGHGRIDAGQHFVLTRASPGMNLSNTKALSPRDLIDRLAGSRADQAVVVLDTCHSGAALSDVRAALQRALDATRGPGTDLAALVSCLPHEKAYEGEFTRTLAAALQEGSQHGNWRDSEPTITLYELRNELRCRVRTGGQNRTYAETAGHDGVKIPNPRHVTVPDHPVGIGALLAGLSADDRNHFLLKASGADAVDIGWYFTGRQGPTAALLDWLAGHPNGLAVVTGAPGVGKSALLGRLAVLADPGSAPACGALGMLDDPPETIPPPGLFDAVVHARSRTVHEVADLIADQVELRLDVGDNRVVPLLRAVDRTGAGLTVLVDALDEAAAGQITLIARDLLREIARRPNCRVVVGTRPDRHAGVDDRSDPGADRLDSAPLLNALDPGDAPHLVIPLDEEADADIGGYTERRLARSEGWTSEEHRHAAGRAVAGLAAGNYLYARFAVRVLESRGQQLVDEPGWEQTLPADVGDAGLHEVFAHDIARSDDPVRVREVLTPLAYARGRGLPRRQIWAALATELARSGRSYSGAEVARTIDDAGWYLIEGTEHGQAVFRLYHQGIADYLRSELEHGD